MSAEHAGTDDPNRVVVVVNPYCTQADHPDSLARLNELREAFGNRFVEIRTTGIARVDQAVLVEILEEGDRVGVAGGEGTVRSAMEILVRGRLKNPLFSLWFGNGNDFGNVMLGAPNERPSTLIREATSIPIHPIEARISNEKEERFEEQLAASYIGFGFAATVAELFNSDTHRQRPGYKKSPVRIAYEGLTILHEARRATQFTVRIGDEEIRMLDWLFANGPRIAKFGQLPVQYEEPQLFTHVEHDPDFLSISSWLARLMAGTLPEDFIEDDEPPVAFELLTDNTAAYFDAETVRYNAGTHVAIQRHDTPFYALQVQNANNKTTRNP